LVKLVLVIAKQFKAILCAKHDWDFGKTKCFSVHTTVLELISIPTDFPGEFLTSEIRMGRIWNQAKATYAENQHLIIPPAIHRINC
jgi:hypothetical protein